MFSFVFSWLCWVQSVLQPWAQTQATVHILVCLLLDKPRLNQEIALFDELRETPPTPTRRTSQQGWSVHGNVACLKGWVTGLQSWDSEWDSYFYLIITPSQNCFNSIQFPVQSVPIYR